MFHVICGYINNYAVKKKIMDLDTQPSRTVFALGEQCGRNWPKEKGMRETSFILNILFLNNKNYLK